jgi:hypothetical protein
MVHDCASRLSNLLFLCFSATTGIRASGNLPTWRLLQQFSCPEVQGTGQFSLPGRAFVQL